MKSSLVTASAVSDSYRLTTQASFREDLNEDIAFEDAYLGRLIDRASDAICQYARRTLAKQSYSETFRDVCGMESLSLRHYPVTAIASVTEDGTAVSSGDYEYDAASGVLYRLSSDARTSWNAAKIVIAYTAGYVLPAQTLVGAGASGSRTLPHDIEQAAIVAVRAAYLSRGNDPGVKSYNIPGVITEDTGASAADGLPAEAKMLLNPYRRILV